MDPKNLQILRDLSMLQIQMRDLDGFAVTRNTLLTLKPNAKINWMAFALARHMCGDLQGAIKVIDIYLGTLTEGSAELGRCFESSELALYKNSIIAEIPNNYKEALDQLSVCEAITVDRGAWLMKRAEYQLNLKDYAAARHTVNQTFERGMTECYKIHSLFMCILLQVDDDICNEALQLRGTQTLATMMPLSDDQKNVIIDAYRTDLGPKHPKSHAIQRIPSTLMENADLRRELDVRCRRDLTRGVPSLCSELRSYLWTVKGGRYVRTEDPVDVKENPRYELFVEMVDGYISNLEADLKFAPSDQTEEEPSTLFWAWYLRAGLHELAGEYTEGIAFVNKCFEHTPTAVDAHELKARLLKASGNIEAAAACLDQGRDLDRQDRYINNQTTKYMLQAGKEEEALTRISMFTRHEGNPEQNLYDMQCSWYELELAACLAKKQEWGCSLKKYGKQTNRNTSSLRDDDRFVLTFSFRCFSAAVVKHFDDFHEDQFDFHSYCLRKVTLRAYISVLRFEDVVYGQDYFCEAAAGIIRIYLHLYDIPTSNETEEPDYSKMDAAQRKKAKAIARKKKKSSEKKETDIKAKGEEVKSGNEKQNQKGGKVTVADEDPLGLEYLKKVPLEEAKKYSSMLAKYAPKNLETWTLQYDVAMRRKKPMLALQALFKARSIDSESSELFSRIIDFNGKMDGFNDSPGAARSVISEETPSLLGNQSACDFIKSATTKIRENPLTDLPMRTAVVKAVTDANIEPIKNAVVLITDGGMDSRKVSVETSRAALDLLRILGTDAEKAANRWTDAIQKRFPDAL